MIKACPLCGSSELTAFGSFRDHSISGETFLLKSCEACSFIITVDAPEESEIGKYYQSDVYISHSDTRKGFMDKIYHVVRQRMLKKKHEIVTRHSAQPEGRLLDIGSGTGYFPGYMKAQGWNVEGIEVDQSARQKSIDQFGIRVFDQSHIASLENSTYDAITMWHVLEHVRELKEYGLYISNALKPDGTLIIAVPNHLSTDARIYSKEWAAWDVPRHLWHFSPRALGVFAKMTGFKVIKSYPMPMDAFYVSLLSEKYRGRAGLNALIRGTWTGLRSNLKARRNPGRSSSVIYILKKLP